MNSDEMEDVDLQVRLEKAEARAEKVVCVCVSLYR